jgi:hypothetical protein
MLNEDSPRRYRSTRATTLLSGRSTGLLEIEKLEKNFRGMPLSVLLLLGIDSRVGTGEGMVQGDARATQDWAGQSRYIVETVDGSWVYCSLQF